MLQNAGYNGGSWNISDEPCKVKQITISFVGWVGFAEFSESFEFVESIEFSATGPDAGFRIQDAGNRIQDARFKMHDRRSLIDR